MAAANHDPPVGLASIAVRPGRCHLGPSNSQAHQEEACSISRVVQQTDETECALVGPTGATAMCTGNGQVHVPLPAGRASWTAVLIADQTQNVLEGAIVLQLPDRSPASSCGQQQWLACPFITDRASGVRWVGAETNTSYGPKPLQPWARALPTCWLPRSELRSSARGNQCQWHVPHLLALAAKP